MVCNKDEGTKSRTHTGGPSAPSRARRTTLALKSRNRGTKVARAHTSSARTPARCYQRSDSFWTRCHRCNMQYEFPTTYCNCNLHCWSCEKSFMASVKAPATIWTFCRRCNRQYEHHKMYRNRTLSCINCRESFVASEIAQPV